LSEAGCLQENEMAAKDISKLKLGPIGDRVMYENEMVRVWDFVVEPGKSKGWHRHDLPYVIIPMTDGDIELESALTGDIERLAGRKPCSLSEFAAAAFTAARS